MPTPTNADIMRELGVMHATLAAVEEQTKKTNGRVTKIEEWKNALQAVEAYKKETQPTTMINAEHVTVQPKWFENEKLVAGVVAILLAASAFITWFVSSHGGGQ